MALSCEILCQKFGDSMFDGIRPMEVGRENTMLEIVCLGDKFQILTTNLKSSLAILNINGNFQNRTRTIFNKSTLYFENQEEQQNKN